MQGNDLQCKTEAARQVQDFDVEAEAIDALTAEHGARGVGAERLEAALRILDAGHRQGLHDPVEHAPHEMPVDRFADAACAHTLTRADDNRGALVDERDEARQVLHLPRQIRVSEDNDSALRGEHARPDGAAFAPAVGAQQSQRRESKRGLLNDGRGGVARTVVNDDDLAIQTFTADIGFDL